MEIVVILHNIRSLQNVGSIFRTADAAGVKKIYLCGITPAPIDVFGKSRQQMTKISLGAEKYVQWDGSINSPRAISKLLEKLKKDGYKIFAIEQNKKSIIYSRLKISKNSKIALILGGEVKGLPKSISDKSDRILEIPMHGKMVRHAHHPKNYPEPSRGKESLNVAVAFGIVVFHILNCYNHK